MAKRRWLTGLRKLPGGGGFAVGVVMLWWNQPVAKPVPGPLDEWLTNPDIVQRRIERMTQQRFVADAILGPGYPRRRYRLTWRYKLRRAWRNLRERVARSGEVE